MFTGMFYSVLKYSAYGIQAMCLFYAAVTSLNKNLSKMGLNRSFLKNEFDCRYFDFHNCRNIFLPVITWFTNPLWEEKKKSLEGKRESDLEKKSKLIPEVGFGTSIVFPFPVNWSACQTASWSRSYERISV